LWGVVVPKLLLGSLVPPWIFHKTLTLTMAQTQTQT
jgi:hypothetical protein